MVGNDKTTDRWYNNNKNVLNTIVGGAKHIWHHLLNKKTKYPLKNLFLGG